MFKLVVLFSVLALAAAKPSVLAPLAYNYPLSSVSSVSQYSSDVLHGTPLVPGVPAVYGAYSPGLYSTAVVPGVTFAQAPNSPAVVLDAVNGVPLDTPEVVAARAAHYQAKALNVHHLRKRSVSPLSYGSVVSPVSPLVRSVVSPLSYSTPFVSAYSSPYVTGYPSAVSSLGYSTLLPKAYSVHPW